MKIILAGSTGYIGREVLKECLAHAEVSSIVALSRLDLNISHAKLRVMVVDNDDFFLHHPPELLSHVQEADACIYCLGTNVPVKPAELNRKINFEFAISTVRSA